MSYTIVSEKESEYRFQYMDKNKNLICRWDSAPHHKEISTFPYHLHTINKVKESKKMNFIKVVDDVAEKVIGHLNL